MIAGILGGIGLFLLGMVLMTDGLKSAAGDALRRILRRFTGGPVTAIASGATLTAMVQSSSATVLTTIGFVSAGLLTFTQAVGVIFGANLGTTSTGWIVALLGLKLSIGALALPLVGVGALMRLLGRGRVPALGLALAGFGLIFVGIDTLQVGMEALGTRVDPTTFPRPTLAGRFLLVGIGAVMTVVMQSSSAAVATTLTALYTGTVDIQQAAALVVGQNVGTTVTAGLAAIGATVAARRTALAHVLFNVLAGVVAFLLLPFIPDIQRLVSGPSDATGPALIIAGFHTGFNLLGVLILVPFTAKFADLVSRMVPERGPVLTRFLDPSLMEVPAVALEAARRTILETAATILETFRGATADPQRRRVPVQTLDVADSALAETGRFLATLHGAEGPTDREWHLSLLHAIDHLDRLTDRLRRSTPTRRVDDPVFDELRVRAGAALGPAVAWLRGATDETPVASLERISRDVADRRREERRNTLEVTAGGGLEPGVALRRLEAVRWLDSSLYHTWRATHHLALPNGAPEPADGSDV
ncbi:MAG TPA: Na/Pi symporter [Longimicrobiales bacterium]|nr:Na/Pi symporter [Longimicrobiales bacterium]